MFGLIIFATIVLIIVGILHLVNLSFQLWHRFKYYTKQGLKIDFFYPFKGQFYYLKKGISQHDDPGYYLKQIMKQQQQKQVVVGHVGFRPVLFLADPELIQEFLIQKYELYTKDNRISTYLGDFLQNGLLFAEGNQWKIQRKLISQAFHFDYLKKATPQIIEIVKEHFDSLQNLDIVYIMNEVQKITGDVVCRLFFGKNFSKLEINGIPISVALSNHIVDIIQQERSVSTVLLGNILRKFNFTQRTKRIASNNKLFRELASKTIQERKSNLQDIYDRDPERKDLLQLLIEQENPQYKLSEDELIGNFLTFFFAGMDTTGHLVTSLLWFLNKYPKYLDQVKNEIQSLIHSKNDINQNNLQQLKILDACIKETQRLMPPVPVLIFRCANQEHKLGNINIKQGTLVAVSIWSITLGKGLINEDEFIPERWLNGETNDKLDSILKIPFSAGPRNCIGQHLALLETKIITIIFLNQFKYTTLAPSEFKLTSSSLIEFKEPFTAKLQKLQPSQ